MTVFIDNEFKCHTTQTEGLKAVDTSFFDGKCDTFIEGYRFIPAGESWTDKHGIIYTGEKVFPWKSFRELDITQRTYEHEQYLLSLERDTQYLDAYNEGVNEV